MDLGLEMENELSSVVKDIDIFLASRQEFSNCRSFNSCSTGRGIRHRGFAYESLGALHPRLVR